MISNAHLTSRITAFTIVLLTLTAGSITPAMAAKCGSTGNGFSAWLADFKGEAQRRGISRKTINRSFKGVGYDRRLVRRDRSQRSFKLSFNTFYKRRVGSYLMKRARSRLKRHQRLLNRIEKRFGVPREILIAIWGLETNFGRDGSGKHYIIQSIATLSYDCRRSSFFKRHLHAALRIVQRGDMSPRQMRGGWAGEIGQVHSCRHPTTSTPLTMMVTAAAICAVAYPTFSLRPPTTCARMDGSGAAAGTAAQPITAPSRSGTGPKFTRGRSR